MRGVILAASLAALMAGSAAAQTAAPQSAAPPAAEARMGPSPQPIGEKKPPAAPAPKIERVCKSEPIANSRLKSKKICVTRSEYERTRAARKQMVREQMEKGGAQTSQGGG